MLQKFRKYYNYTHTQRSRIFYHTNQCKLKLKGQLHEDEIACTESLQTISSSPDLKMAKKNMWQLKKHFYSFKTTQFNWFDINIEAYLNYEQSSVLNHVTFNGNSLANRLRRECLS